jgi:hypothetical protein
MLEPKSPTSSARDTEQYFIFMFEPPVAASKVPNGQSDQRNLSPPKLTLPTRGRRYAQSWTMNCDLLLT